MSLPLDNNANLAKAMLEKANKIKDLLAESGYELAVIYHDIADTNSRSKIELCIQDAFYNVWSWEIWFREGNDKYFVNEYKGIFKVSNFAEILSLEKFYELILIKFPFIEKTKLWCDYIEMRTGLDISMEIKLFKSSLFQNKFYHDIDKKTYGIFPILYMLKKKGKIIYRLSKTHNFYHDIEENKLLYETEKYMNVFNKDIENTVEINLSEGIEYLKHCWRGKINSKVFAI